MIRYLTNLWVAYSQLLSALLGGSPLLTVSANAHVLQDINKLWYHINLGLSKAFGNRFCQRQYEKALDRIKSM